MTGWTDSGMTWPVVAGTPIMPYGEALRLALVERCTAAGVAVPTILQSELTTGRPARGAWGLAFDATMDALIPSFVNHTDSGGHWTGAAFTERFDYYGTWAGWVPTFAPRWSESSILAAIGDATRIRVVSVMRAEWAQQQYALLNMLRWTFAQLPYQIRGTISVPTTFVSEYRKTGNQTDYAALSADWAGQSWQALTGTVVGFGEDGHTVASAIHYAGGGNFYAIRVRRQQAYTISGQYGSLRPQIDIYAPYTHADFGSTFFGEYEDLDTATTEPCLVRIVQDAEPVDGTITYQVLPFPEVVAPSAFVQGPMLGDFDDMPASQAPAATNNNARGYFTDQESQPGTFPMAAIEKWDVSGGFSFIA